MHNFFKSIIVTILTAEAKRVLRICKPVIILVSGSVGKTSTKDAIYHVLAESLPVRKSIKSFNSELGVPLTILGLENGWTSPLLWIKNIIKGYTMSLTNYPKLLVLEVGSDHPGDIKRLLSWITPDIAVVTCLPEVPVHVENFDSPEQLRKEDALVADSLHEGSILIINADDAFSRALEIPAKERGVRVLSYGFSEASLQARNPTIRYAMRGGVEAPIGMEYQVVWEGKTYPVHLDGVIGTTSLSATLAGLAVGTTRGLSMQDMSESVLHLETPPGRMRIIEGRAWSTIIDDSYNSSPIALTRALETLKQVVGKRKIAMLGDMLELGRYSQDEHWNAGRLAGAFVDELVTVGTRSRWLAEGAKSAGLPQGRIHQFANALEAGNFIASILEKDDIILAKGSQGSGEDMIRIERGVKVLMAHPEEAEKILVRQEEWWQKQYK